MKGELEIAEGDRTAGLSQFQVKPGVVTFCRLAEYDNEWKMLIAAGEIIPSDEELAGTWGWVEVCDHKKLYRTLVEEGFVHHASMIHGDQTQALLRRPDPGPPPGLQVPGHPAGGRRLSLVLPRSWVRCTFRQHFVARALHIASGEVGEYTTCQWTKIARRTRHVRRILIRRILILK
jgi:hypothetical protein